MQVIFKARNMEIAPELRKYAEKRLAKFDKLIGADEALVTMQTNKERHRLEITIPYNGITIRGEEENYDMYTAIDNVTAKLESQIHKYRNRLIKRGRGAAKEMVMTAPEADSTYLEDEPPVRTKTYTTKPMTTEEAIMQMNLLGHSFFVFINMENDAVNVVYLRHDNTYGLLVPEK
jgi:putative sigma-54 modulation protein